jgi:hypothetical protein
VIGGSISICVEYLITTTSDWTTFQIIEGGWWSNHHVVCLEGFDRLTQEILYNEKTILISKNPMDRSRVVVSAKCILNIAREYLQSNITYLITKGDIESTVVRVIADEKEYQPLVNATKIPDNPRNPLSFNVPVKHYLQVLKEKKNVEKGKGTPEEKPHIIITTFNELFKEIIQKKDPSEKDVEEVFKWLQSHGENATKFLEADIYRDLTLQAETCFWRFSNLKKKVNEESSKTLKKIKDRYDDLRKIQGKIAVQTPYLGGVEREERKVAPDK